jgi:carotenoid cleavage dioxygenase
MTRASKRPRTANTQIFYHHGRMLALKEDSPPVAVDPLTLETLDDYYTFGGAMRGQTFTASGSTARPAS